MGDKNLRQVKHSKKFGGREDSEAAHNAETFHATYSAYINRSQIDIDQ